MPLRVTLEGVSKSFAQQKASVKVLHDISLTVPAGSFVTILGPSGSGKSTLLNIIAGLDEPDEGRVLLAPEGGQPLSTRLGNVGYMPQRDLLLPWRTALDNACLGLEVAGASLTEARVRALPLFREFGLEGFTAAYPHQLSGGMRQRISFLRSSLVARGLMLLDEPFGALDALTRAGMQEWLLGAMPRTGATSILVTHDIDEAVLLSGTVYVLSPRPGRIIGHVPIGLPYPRTLETANEIGFAEHRAELLSMLRSMGSLGTPLVKS